MADDDLDVDDVLQQLTGQSNGGKKT